MYQAKVSALALTVLSTLCGHQLLAEVPLITAAHLPGGSGSSFNTIAGIASDGPFLFDNETGQTFIAQRGGRVTDVAFISSRITDETTPDLRIDLTELQSGQPTTILGSTFLPASGFEFGFLSSPITELNQFADFSASEIVLTAGREYAIIFSTDTPDANYRLHGNTAGFAGGALIDSQNGSPFEASNSLDLFFQVQVENVPEPSSALLIGSLATALVGWRRNRYSQLPNL